jgi:hypothetical protein
MAAWALCDLLPGVRPPWGEDGLLDLADPVSSDAPDEADEDAVNLDLLGEELGNDLAEELQDADCETRRQLALRAAGASTDRNDELTLPPTGRGAVW